MRSRHHLQPPPETWLALSTESNGERSALVLVPSMSAALDRQV
jgi:hypothetical protein